MIRVALILGGILASLVCTGCDPVNLLVFRRQVAAWPPRYENDPAHRVVRLRFAEPILSEASVTAAGVPLERDAGGRSVANYTMRFADCPDEAVQVVFRFRDSKLESVEMPDLLPELLGKRNVAALFRMAGGASLDADAFEDIPASRAEELIGRHYDRPVRLGLTFTGRLIPKDRACREILVTFKRGSMSAPFKDLTFQFKRREKG